MLISSIKNFNTTSTQKIYSTTFRAKVAPTKALKNLGKDVLEITKTEKEKMISGLMYNPSSDQLRADKAHAQDLWFRFNLTHPKKKEKRKKIIKELLGKTGEKFKIETGFKCDYGYNIEIGENFFANYNLTILDPGKVKFGDNVFIGPNCSFYTSHHPFDPELRATGEQCAKPITVGNNVWFGGDVTVVGGVTIGDNVIIGAGSVVVKDLPSNTICCGNPCKVKKNNSPEKPLL